MPSIFRLGLMALAAAFIGNTTACADNWDRFHGPNGTGVSNDKNVPVHFGPKNNIRWKVPIAGTGNSSPIVWGNRIFLHTSSPDAKQRALLCLDTDGNEIWKRSIPAGKATIHPMSSFASSTPTTDGQAVYVAFWDGKDIIVAAYNFKGDRLWDRNLGPFVSQHGWGASPILYKDKLILADDMDAQDMKSKRPVPNPSKLYAFNKKTGATIWEVSREAYRACYSAPFLIENSNTPPELLITSSMAITSYNPDTGKPNWNWKWTFDGMPLRTVASTAYLDGVLFACSGDGSGDRHMVAVALNGVGKAARPEKLWENKREFPYVTCLLTRGEHVFFTNDGGFAACFNAKTGKKVWYERHPDTKFTASPVMIDGKIYACSEHGDVFVFGAESTYRQLAKNSLGELIRATPAVADGRLYIRSAQHLYCIGTSK